MQISSTRSKNKQLAINMAASIVAFVVNFGINFFLTPFIVSSLGAAAYGFVGLSNNIISYTQLITIALNSMAARFITIKYTQGDIDSANKYFSSVFYCNLILSIFILLGMGIVVFYLNNIFEVPPAILTDVQLLFSILVFNTILGLMTNIYAVATFIKNRLELTSLRQIGGYVIRAFILVLFFGCFSAKLWYIGFAGCMFTMYIGYYNYKYTRLLTPDIKVESKYFDWFKVKELLYSGIWNTISKLGDLLQRGFDLVFANVFIGATEMGILSITTQIPFIILQLFSMLSSNFAPSMTTEYAHGNIEEIKRELSKSVRILSIIMLVPLSALYIYGDVFYNLWIPSQDGHMLQWLTICGTFALVFTSPLESFWNIFTVTNKIKGSSIFVIVNSILVFLTVLILLLVTEDPTAKMFIIASVRSLYGVIRGILFLPIYGAKCLSLKWSYFYADILKPILSLGLVIILLFGLRLIYVPNDWLSFLFATGIVSFISLAAGTILILNKSDIKMIKNKIYDKIKN